ncbi:ATPase, histidine kinase-, DNA gyrase B-, and HSP90-like domain protein [Leptolyngbya sp. NIES-3755]|nr:ATPase, histidine kinase-, DNA gyrase B-, and HSP90-like domain protein [Leptolyngbya sp. NIES-3755]
MQIGRIFYLTQSMRNTRKRRISFKQWRGAFTGVRSRLLLWYFVLTLCITLISVWATFKIFCALEEQQAAEHLQRNISVLEQRIDPNNLATTLEQFTNSQVQDPNQSLFIVVSDQVYSANSRPYPEQIRQWAKSSKTVREGYIIRVVESLRINGQKGAIVGLYDATMRYQMGESTLALVIQVTIVMMVLFMSIAWFTAGRLLAPLRQLTDTAQMITETDLSKRIVVRGTDEIAELSLTFNQMLDRLQAAFTSQQEFIKDVSHELRTPITIIQGHLELLGDDPEERRSTVALVKDELKRMNHFVNDLLLLMRAERPNFLRLSAVDLESFTEELFAKAKGLAPRNWTLESIGEGEIICDRQRITQVMMNLAQNATQYTQHGDTIAIGSIISHNQVHFWVRDTGEGIALEDQVRIFDRFSKGSHSEGAGLGLSIVQALIRAHHGTVELFSRLGEGSRFTVILPKQRSDMMSIVQRTP